MSERNRKIGNGDGLDDPQITAFEGVGNLFREGVFFHKLVQVGSLERSKKTTVYVGLKNQGSISPGGTLGPIEKPEEKSLRCVDHKGRPMDLHVKITSVDHNHEVNDGELIVIFPK